MSILNSAAEEQLHGAGWIPGRARPCRRGCNVDETAYHIAVSCVTPEYNNRHDQVVWWLLRAIMEATTAPGDAVQELTFGKGEIAVDYT